MEGRSRRIFSYSKELPIIKELELTNENLLVEKNNLALVSRTYNEMTNELIKGNNIDSILEILNKQTNLPIVIEDIRQHLLAYKGITRDDYELIRKACNYSGDKYRNIAKVNVLSFENGTRIITPIYL